MTDIDKLFPVYYDLPDHEIDELLDAECLGPRPTDLIELGYEESLQFEIESVRSS